MTDPKDEALKAFLKQNAPQVPPPPQDELQRLMRNLELPVGKSGSGHSVQTLIPSSRTQRGFWVFGGAGALAAGFVCAWFVAQVPSVSPSSSLRTDEILVEVEDLSVPSMDVGEEYLGLIADQSSIR